MFISGINVVFSKISRQRKTGLKHTLFQDKGQNENSFQDLGGKS